MESDRFEHPLGSRYASADMSRIWSPANKFSTWRRLWVALAQAEMELGLPVSEQQVDELRAHIDDIDLDAAAAKEKELRHDVVSHIHVYGDQCPAAAPIIHLGATSCFVTDNTELLQIRAATELIRRRLISVIRALRDFCLEHKSLPTLGYTHYQPAQLVTVGKRSALWLHDLLYDLTTVDSTLKTMPFRGVKGTTGTQASFLELFDGDHDKVRSLDQRVTQLMGFEQSVQITGQTYSRKFDYTILSALSGLAQSAAKMAGDVRLLMNLKELSEPFGSQQVGSSAMAYKQNPMRSERICALARYVISLPPNAAQTHSQQWLERTLDDSANRRLVLPEAFLAADSILLLQANIGRGLNVYPKVIRKRIEQELPFMATENILMACVKAGGDRQELHQALRDHAVAAARVVREDGGENDLLSRIAGDAAFAAVHDSLESMLDPALYIGRAPQQVEEFIAEQVDPMLAKCEDEDPPAHEPEV